VTAAQAVRVVGARRAFAHRVSTGHLVMVIAGLLGALLTLSVLRAADNTRPVLVAAHDIVPGTVVSSRAVRVVRIHADAAVLASLFDAGALRDVVGRVAVQRVAAGSLVTRDAVRAVGSGAAPRAMSFPIAPSQAVAGSLVAGDRVDVLAVRHNSGRSTYVATDVEVLAFAGHRGSALQGSEDATATLAVDSDAAARIASALETGSVTLVRATGAAPLPQNGSR
jgi:Flp pilus assembly protein CpaB